MGAKVLQTFHISSKNGIKWGRLTVRMSTLNERMRVDRVWSLTNAARWNCVDFWCVWESSTEAISVHTPMCFSDTLWYALVQYLMSLCLKNKKTTWKHVQQMTFLSKVITYFMMWDSLLPTNNKVINLKKKFSMHTWWKLTWRWYDFQW